MKFLVFLVLVLSANLVHSQQSSFFNIALQDSKSIRPIPYAHISSEGKLVAITDHFGNARIPKSFNTTYQVSCIGYRPLTFTDQWFASNERIIIKLNPDQKILEAVTITPTTLEDMIREVYENIPNAYVSKPHLLRGELVEKYMDTLSHAHITSSAQLQIQKEPYAKQHSKGEVKIDSLSKTYDVTSSIYTQIYAGAHIPHRFDFVMKREEFINPSGFNKYAYRYLGEVTLQDREVDVIGFTPKSSALVGGQFKGKIYVDMEEKVFLKAEYQYTKSGFFGNPESRWPDQRLFITEYEPSNEGWYFAYTWDEAVLKSENFLLSQYFKTKSIDYDTVVNWSYEEKTHFHDVVEKKAGDSLIILNDTPVVESIPQVEFTRTSTGLYKFLSNIETGFGFRIYSLNQSDISAGGDVIYQGQTLMIDEGFSISSADIGMFWNIRYLITQNLYGQFSQSESFSQRERKRNWDISIVYRLIKQRGRPADFNISLGYGEFVSRFRFDEQADVKPFFQQRNQGFLTGVSYDIRLNARWKLGFGYNYFYPVSTKEKFYLKEQYGLFDLFSKKHDYSTDLMNWELNGEAQTDPVNIFNNHSFDISLIMALD